MKWRVGMKIEHNQASLVNINTLFGINFGVIGEFLSSAV